MTEVDDDRLSLGEIYLCTNKINGKQYVGQVVSYSNTKRGIFKRGFQKRWKDHVNEAKLVGGDKGCSYLNNAILKYGEEAFHVELIVQTHVNDLDRLEHEYIIEYNTKVPNGYNLREGGSSSRHSEVTKQKISASNKGVLRTDDMKSHMSQIKKTDPTLPRYIVLCNDEGRGVTGYRIIKHPTLPERKFTSGFLSMEEKLQQAITYIETGVVENVCRPIAEKSQKWKEAIAVGKSARKTSNLPQYIYETHYDKRNAHGYIVRNHPTLKQKQFISSSLSMEQKLQQANDYINI
jgi:group I intron endonuclease